MKRGWIRARRGAVWVERFWWDLRLPSAGLPASDRFWRAILALAAQRQTVFQGMFLLAVYSAGLAIPFLLTSVGLSSFLEIL